MYKYISKIRYDVKSRDTHSNGHNLLMYTRRIGEVPVVVQVTDREKYELIDEFQRTGSITIKNPFRGMMSEKFNVEDIMFSKISEYYHKVPRLEKQFYENMLK